MFASGERGLPNQHSLSQPAGSVIKTAASVGKHRRLAEVAGAPLHPPPLERTSAMVWRHLWLRRSQTLMVLSTAIVNWAVGVVAAQAWSAA